MATHYIPIRHGQVVPRPTTSIVVAGIGASALACLGISLSAVLHIFGGLSSAPVLAEAVVSSHFWLAVWNILMPVSLLGITLLIYRSWRKHEDDSL